jgi:hypothetical protein
LYVVIRQGTIAIGDDEIAAMASQPGTVTELRSSIGLPVNPAIFLKAQASDYRTFALIIRAQTSSLNRMNRTWGGARSRRTPNSTVRLACCTGGFSARAFC